jgi:hypothetical protein
LRINQEQMLGTFVLNNLLKVDKHKLSYHFYEVTEKFSNNLLSLITYFYYINAKILF